MGQKGVSSLKKLDYVVVNRNISEKKLDEYRDGMIQFPDEMGEWLEERMNEKNNEAEVVLENPRRNPSIGNLVAFGASFANPLWILKYYYRIRYGMSKKDAERRALMIALKIARPIVLIKSGGTINLPPDEMIIKASEVELMDLGKHLVGVLKDPQFIFTVAQQVANMGGMADPRLKAILGPILAVGGAMGAGGAPGGAAGVDPRIATAMAAMSGQGAAAGGIPALMSLGMGMMQPQQVAPAAVAMPQQMVQVPVQPQMVQVPVQQPAQMMMVPTPQMAANPHKCKCGGRLFYSKIVRNGGEVKVLACKCGKKYKLPKMNPQKKIKNAHEGAIVVPTDVQKPDSETIEEAKDQYKEFNFEHPQEVKRVKIALPDSDAPIIEIPGGPVAVEYRSGKETGKPEQKYRHEIEHLPPDVNIGFVKGKLDEGDTIIIYGKKLKVDDWIRG